MNGAGIIDHSPSQPDAVSPIPGASNLIVIDNYDSFTYNVYQYLVLEGANAKVYRNDEITLKEIIDLEPTQLVISPGPGNPEDDAGVSNEAIRYFAGKIPVLGVCIGEQCIFTVFGGKVEMTGEILHGKTSPLKHDGKGLYAGLGQNLPVTRYHSLAGTHLTLPDCLELTSWTERPGDGKGIIMGVRHKELLVEGVQFHPESILTADGRMMIRNFLQMRGGTWEENRRLGKEVSNSQALEPPGKTTLVNGTDPPASKTKPSILQEIFDDRKRVFEEQKKVPSFRPSDLQAIYDLNLAPPQIPFAERLRQSPFKLSLMAEVKRASPSKGDIALDICAPAQAKEYALAGASVISVLTEPRWFKGSVEDMRQVRQILEGMPHRPAVLRKEFIFEKYQILEARINGADTVLLIVKMLSRDDLKKLYYYSQSLGMEPLVEVNTVEEMDIAKELGAKVIGVNNRNLTNFEVDLDTTSRLMEGVSDDTIVCALSGISGPEDVKAYQSNNVKAVLVGEALMKAPNVNDFVFNLLGRSEGKEQFLKAGLNVKICGTRSPEAAKAAIEAGADQIGIILVEGRSRCVPKDVACEISKVVHTTRRLSAKTESNVEKKAASGYFEHSRTHLTQTNRALLVGVFQNQPLTYVLGAQKILDLDIVQLHGSEPIEWARLIPVPVIRRFGPGDRDLGVRTYHTLPLLDSAAGGTGQSVDLEAVIVALKANDDLRVILAGGLTPNNISDILAQLKDHLHQIVGVDVSSGVETDGKQDEEKIKAFIANAKSYC
ncbi:uncharacterized protein KY384_008082 [Bacidia gigantensis]|uniref:uncharacterized protein n=1 Tax=Bacidia gigantensis TaxID=2732470 RepID=UPI001D056048|nr:uncharacterized protein KY384_008082 [Bacidia gigantensis]KAG8526653.1 hypothetical protein KY384_008082 [Bacidia gigantensis]